MAYFLDEDTSLSSNQSKHTNLRQKPDIDYEKLFRPNETLIRIDLTCVDAGNDEKEAKILIRIQDVNDNAPKFINKTDLVIKIDESSRFESILKVNAYDLDLSTEYGNDSLVYSISMVNRIHSSFLWIKKMVICIQNKLRC